MSAWTLTPCPLAHPGLSCAAYEIWLNKVEENAPMDVIEIEPVDLVEVEPDPAPADAPVCEAEED